MSPAGRRAILAGAAGLLAAPALAQATPLRIVVPSAPGGPADVVARMLAETLRLGRPVVVENRTGAGLVAGTEVVARAAPDGNTLLVTTIGHAVNPAMGRLPYDTERDFAPVAHLANTALVLLVNNGFPATDLPGFLAALRARPGGYAYGSAGNGTAIHIAVELLKHQAGVQALHVPYRGTAPAMADLIAGHIQFMMDVVVTGAPHVQRGSVRAIAVTTRDRAALLPEVPTFAEQGMPEFEAYTWNVLLAPAQTPAPVIAQLNAAVNDALRAPELSGRMRALGYDPVLGSTPEGTGRFMAAEAAKWGGIVRAAGIRAAD
ncbi:tripartite tricarboxylate transporter substrate binding protein [Falsiroseomonas oryzae]|uniref:tripartite tricarboxylate transporter substrate binding protein n=1 Tax=Falsiroseomonas oryzae TaxID=2766473 RepID=UPI0022EA3E10|nr:tripartite tricarboxylate transporter substrate binding protein [Roseomonas sp. MO-31]